MRSRANFRTHPIHPMLIPFPLAFLVGGFLADVGSVLFDSGDLRVTGWYLIAAGVVGGLIAAVPGFIDYRATVPPHSSGKQRARRHMVVNLSALVLFAAVWWLRGGPGVPPDSVLLVMEAAGVALLTFGGWMGGTLVYRNQIGVDHRYSEAGKWSEMNVAGTAAEPVAVARADELEVDQMKLVRMKGKRIVLARSSAGYVAFADRCSHKGGSLAGGTMTCDRVICPWHGSQFDVKTGEVCAGPAERGVESYPVEVVNNTVRVQLGDSAQRPA